LEEEELPKKKTGKNRAVPEEDRTQWKTKMKKN